MELPYCSAQGGSAREALARLWEVLPEYLAQLHRLREAVGELLGHVVPVVHRVVQEVVAHDGSGVPGRRDGGGAVASPYRFHSERLQTGVDSENVTGLFLTQLTHVS